MREILFRGKRIDNGEWVEGAFVPDATEPTHGDMVTWGFIRRYNRKIGKMETIEVERETVGQYTGLTDKNGEKIFEGDVLKTAYTIPNEPLYFDKRHCVVRFHHGGFVVCRQVLKQEKAIHGLDLSAWLALSYIDGQEWDDLRACFGRDVLLVMGNIHDNPELLEVEL